MADETTAALKEIAGLLKRRVEQEDAVAGRAAESSRRSAEFSAQMKTRTEESRALSDETRRKSEEWRKQMSPENRDKFRTEMDQKRDEERQFRKSLLSELERHNTLLSEILDRLGKSPIV